jgi:hypothetical protein
LKPAKDLDSPVKRGYAYRFSPVRIAQCVLLSNQEKIGIITEGLELLILISDSARQAIEGFIQSILDNPQNQPVLFDRPS